MATDRIQVLDYKLFGQKVVEWALDESKRPANLDDLKTQLSGIAIVPARFTSLEIAQATQASVLLLKLPNKVLVQESVDRFTADLGQYPAPLFYFDKLCSGGAEISNMDFFYSRIADYTTAECM